MCGRRFASPRRRYEPARGAEDALRFGGRVDSRGDAVPHLLDGLDRAQAGQGHLEPDARVVSVERDARQLSYRDEPAVLLERRRQQPHRRPLSCRHLHRAGGPGGGLRGALRLPWPDCVRRDGHRRPDGPAQRAGHPGSPADGQRGPGRQPAWRHRLLPGASAPAHDLDAARVRRQRAGRPRGGGDGRRRHARQRVYAHSVPARRAGPGRHGHLRLHPGMERVHHRLRAPELQLEADAHHLARLVPHPARNRLGWAHGWGDTDGSACRGLLPHRAATCGGWVARGGGQGLIVASIERLADRCLLPGFIGTNPPDWILRRAAAGLGGVCLYARNVESPPQLAALTARLHAENPRLVIAIDEEGGDVTRLEAATGSSYPGNLALGTVDDVDLTRSVARSMGAELAAAGVDLDLAPDADVNSNPINPVIGVRAFGSTADRVAAHTAAWITGLQEAGVAACAKHFPGHGDTSIDSHLDLPVVDQDPHEGALELRDAIAAAVKGGRISEARLMEAAARVDALAGWRSSQSAHVTPDRAIGLAAARRAISADGRVRVDGQPVVVQLTSTPSQAAGVVPWGITTPLLQLGAHVTAIELHAEHADVDAIVGRAAGRSLVLG